MTQVNKETGKSRAIRAPNKWKAPKEPLVPPGKTTVVNVPRGAPGTTIQVPYPGIPGAFIAVNVPKSAKPGQAILVPVPDAPTHATAAAVGGAILGDHIAEHGLDATVEAAGEGLADAGEAIDDFVVDAGEFIVDAAEDTGDFIMDLF